jgi:luciferase family oxidoreductase group 1
MKSYQDIQLSVLDQSIIRPGATAAEAVQETITLAQRCDALGFTRFWVSEHHNIPVIAGSSPAILITKLAGVTKRIRVGAGGVMLPNHSSLTVAENFRLLEVLYPGRIDLGIGRAPGGDRITAYLLNPSNDHSNESFRQQLSELNAFFTDTAATSHGKILAIPQAATAPAQWMLTSGGTAHLAGELGMGLALPRFINPTVTPEAVVRYKENFRSSALFPEPKTALGVFVICADTETQAQAMQKAVNLMFLQMDAGKLRGIPTYEEASNYHFAPAELERLKFHRNKVVAGTADSVREQLEQLAGAFDVDEMIATTISFTPEEKLRSVELLSDAFDLRTRTQTALADVSFSND